MNFAELLAQPGVEEVCELRSQFGFMAFHGGALEAMTDVIARAAADASGASYYGALGTLLLGNAQSALRAVVPRFSAALQNGGQVFLRLKITRQ